MEVQNDEFQYWEFIIGNEVEPFLPNALNQQEMHAFKEWHEKANVLDVYQFLDSMIVHIQDASTPKEAWDTLAKMYSTNTLARKMQLKQELHNVQRESMSINDYYMKVKKIADALASIRSPVEDDDLVSMTLNGLGGKDYAQFRTSISIREKIPDFEELIALLISEEQRNGGAASSGGTSKEIVFYLNAGRGRGRGRGGRS